MSTCPQLRWGLVFLTGHCETSRDFCPFERFWGLLLYIVTSNKCEEAHVNTWSDTWSTTVKYWTYLYLNYIQLYVKYFGFLAGFRAPRQPPGDSLRDTQVLVIFPDVVRSRCYEHYNWPNFQRLSHVTYLYVTSFEAPLVCKKGSS